MKHEPIQNRPCQEHPHNEGTPQLKAARGKVESDLQDYSNKKRKITLLRFEYARIPELTESEVIEGLALSHSVENGIQGSGSLSDKTMQIAMRFQDEKERLNHESRLDILDELLALEEQTDQLEFYVSQLDEVQANVIRRHYFDGKSWRELQDELHISSRTLGKRRSDAIDALAAMYQYIGSVKKGERRG